VVAGSGCTVESGVSPAVVVVTGATAEEGVANASFSDSSTTSSTKILSGRKAKKPAITTIALIPTIGHFQRAMNLMSTPFGSSYG
jgi:hypothetical protein